VLTTAANEAATIPHFSLSIVRGANVLLVDDGLAAGTDQAEYLSLLSNMLFAVGAQVQQLSLETFNWPMIKNAQIDQSELAARQTLQAFLAKQLSQIDNSYLLVMGETGKHYIATGEQADAQGNGSFIACEQLGAQMICTQSAVQMLENPALKRQVWQDLQPLYRVLKKR
jgi:hypothetical protein